MCLWKLNIYIKIAAGVRDKKMFSSLKVNQTEMAEKRLHIMHKMISDSIVKILKRMDAVKFFTVEKCSMNIKRNKAI